MEAFQNTLADLRAQQQQLETAMSQDAAQHQQRLHLLAEDYECAPTTIAEAGSVEAVAPATKELAADEAQAAVPNANGNEKAHAASARGEHLKRYFDAMSNYPDYHERRMSRLNEIKPFSFQLREAKRSKSTRTRRIEEQREADELAYEEEHGQQFRANPVPPSTYLHKYDLMVQEWCARKESIRLLAEEKAREMKEKAQPGKEYAKAFMQSKTSVRPRAVSAHEPKKHPPFVAKEIPIDCKVKKWEQLRLAEEERRQRIRFRAELMLSCSKRPPRMEAETKENAEKEKEIDRLAKDRDAAVNQLRESNPNFTFQPAVTPAVPDYEYLWAKDKVEMTKRKQSKPTTVPAEFHLRETLNTKGRIEMEMRREAQEGVEQRWPYKSSRAKVKPTPIPKPVPESQIKRPSATKAHAMKCETAYRSIADRGAREEEDARLDRKLRERQKAINERVGPYLGKGHRTEHAEVIAQKVAEKKAAMKESSDAAKQSLIDLKQRVKEKPPLFMEPAYLDQVAAARATAEEQVIAMLKDHGLADATLSAVMQNPNKDSGTVEHVSASDVEPSSAAQTATIDERSLVTPEAATTHVQPAPVAAAVTAAPAATATKAKKKRSSSASSSYSDSFDSDSDSSSLSS